MHYDAVVGDLEGVPPTQEGTATKLDDLKRTFGRPANQLVHQLDDAIHHRMLRADLGALGTGEQEHRATRGYRYGLQGMNELVERLLIGSSALGGYDAVEHENIAAALAYLPAHQSQQ